MSFPSVVWLFLLILWDLSGFYISQENHFPTLLVQTSLSPSTLWSVVIMSLRWSFPRKQAFGGGFSFVFFICIFCPQYPKMNNHFVAGGKIHKDCFLSWAWEWSTEYLPSLGNASLVGRNDTYTYTATLLHVAVPLTIWWWPVLLLKGLLFRSIWGKSH